MPGIQPADSSAQPTRPTEKLRWYQYRLRSLFVVTILVALASSWFAVEMQRAGRQKEQVAALMKAGGYVCYDVQQRTKPGSARFGSQWLRNLLGDDFCRDVKNITFYGSKITDADLAHLEGLDRLVHLYLMETKITDAGLQHLEGLKQLQVLDLSDTAITDAGLERLKGLTKLRILELQGTRISDAGLKNLQGMTQLIAIRLGNTGVSDAGLEPLEDLKSLQVLALRKTKVTDAGIAKLKKALPQLQIQN
jgi:hypothetical protein